MNTPSRHSRRNALAVLALSLLALVGCASTEEAGEPVITEMTVQDISLPEPVPFEETRLAAIQAEMAAEKEATLTELEERRDARRAEEAERSAHITGIQEDLVAMGYLTQVTGKKDGATARALYDLGYDTNQSLRAADDDVAALVAELRTSGHTNPPTPPGEVAVRSTQSYQDAREKCLTQGIGCPGEQDTAHAATASTDESFTTVVIGRGDQSLVDECLGAVEMQWGDLSYPRPYIVQHNDCGGRGALDVPVGGTITFAGGGLHAGTYVVVDSVDIPNPDFHPDVNLHVLDPIQGELIFQTCYDAPSTQMRGMGLVPIEKAAQYGF